MCFQINQNTYKELAINLNWLFTTSPLHFTNFTHNLVVFHYICRYQTKVICSYKDFLPIFSYMEHILDRQFWRLKQQYGTWTKFSLKNGFISYTKIKISKKVPLPRALSTKQTSSLNLVLWIKQAQTKRSNSTRNIVFYEKVCKKYKVQINLHGETCTFVDFLYTVWFFFIYFLTIFLVFL